MSWKKSLFRISMLALLYLSVMLIFYTIQPGLVFRPLDLKKDFTFQFDKVPEEFFISVDPKTDINALKFPTSKNRKGAIIYFHPFQDNIQRWGHLHKDFTARGYDFWVYDYRGFGKSAGDVSEAELFSDAQKIYDWINEKYPSEDILLYGKYMGGVVAANLANQVTADMLILEAPFNDLDHLFKKQYPWIWQPLKSRVDFSIRDQLALGIEAPVHIIHGTRDFEVNFHLSVYLKEFLRAKDSYTLVDAGRHEILREFSRYQAKLQELL
ncbi:MAG: hypothetical protein HKN16_01940 [Saprospiraceae bacterium]|nr:hypothetical protein [Saprospiraceae bacterium]